jgi:uncharacterized membrane protein
MVESPPFIVHSPLAHSHVSAMCGYLLQLFITTTGVFMSSWLGSTLLSLGEVIIKRLPLVKHIYSASKQVRRNEPTYTAGACRTVTAAAACA